MASLGVILTTLHGTIDSSLSLDFTDVTLYYELLDTGTEVDAGVTLRYIKGDMGVVQLQ